MPNQFCQIGDLHNEADVEQNFIRRLLEALGYSDREIRPKNSLEELMIGGMRGMPQSRYRPDFALKVQRHVRWIVEAKGPGENLDAHVWQPRAYCVLLNGGGAQHVKYYMLSNGVETRVYDPGRNEPVLQMQSDDFHEQNRKYRDLVALLGRATITRAVAQAAPTITFKRPTLAEVNASFSWCHQQIYRMDNISQSDAFTEFVKIVSLKLMSDRRVKDRNPELVQEESFEIPAPEVAFSVHWIEQNEENARNPVSDIQFANFMQDMERQIAQGNRKRIFEQGDRIRLRPETIKAVVRRLEKAFLFGIDADLNGRLFETFLNATMRGKDLGQFFTPRSLVKLGVRLSQLRVHEGRSRHTDTVVDACCGTGGFLIDVLADMWRKVDRRADLADDEKARIKTHIANHAIVGADIANAPILARIARLNMYLHGDGGTRIFHLNALDKDLAVQEADSTDLITEKSELRGIIRGEGFDVALTNPPFAKAIDRKTDDEVRILNQYRLGSDTPGAVRSALLFIERYYDLLKEGGRLVTVIDDGILSGADYAWFRNRLREWFLIRAVVSLPGDAFQRSNARVKTSYLILEKRANSRQQQPPVFMFPCQYVGNDDPKRQRARAGDDELRRLAEAEIDEVIREYEAFQSGNGSPSYTVPADRVADRLDVKNCLVSPGRQVGSWRQSGFQVYRLEEMLQERQYTDDDVVTRDSEDVVRVAIVRYEGVAEAGDEINPADSSYARLYPVSAGDVVISNIAASHGSIAVIPAELDGAVVSSEYTVLQCQEGFDPIIVQLVLRSPEIRADILLSSSGANRTRARWDLIKDIEAPYPDAQTAQQVRASADAAERAKREAQENLERARSDIERQLLLSTQQAQTVLRAFKPPK